MGVETEGHDSFLGGWVQTKAIAFFFSTQSHSEIGKLDITHKSPALVLASIKGKDFAMQLEKGAVLHVYELSNSPVATLKNSP